MDKLERRYLEPIADSFRAVEEDGKRYVEGYASLFETESKLIFERGDLFTEIIERGAFDKVLADVNLNVIYNFNHDKAKLIARTKNNSLELSTDEVGLKFRAEIPNVSYANDVYELIRTQALYENSFAFAVKETDIEITRDKDGKLIRRVKEISRLSDVSTVVNGAYSGTSIWARGITEFIDSEVTETETREAQPLEKNDGGMEKFRLDHKTKTLKKA